MRLKRTACVAAIAATAVAGLAACGGDKGRGKVGIILPDTKSSARWEGFDQPLLTQALKRAGIPYVIQNAEGDKQRMQTIADQMITSGVTILAIVNLDSGSGAAIERKARQQGVQTIDYDRLTLGGSADYYVSFDGVEVGRTQGSGLQRCLGGEQADIAYLDGAPTDNNATLFRRGAHEVLDRNTRYRTVEEQAVPDWDNQKAATIFEQMYTNQRGGIDGVLAANDGLGNAAVAVLKKNDDAGKVPVTGQDATPQGLQNVLAGAQCMTVYKPIKREADGLVQVVTALAKGRRPQTNATSDDPQGRRRVPSILLKPIAIYKENVKLVVADGFVKSSEICTGSFAARCREAGIE